MNHLPGGHCHICRKYSGDNLILRCCFLTLNRRSNALVLADDLDADTVQILVNAALGDLFPEQCKEWSAKKQDIRDIFLQEQTRRESAVAQDIDNNEGPLRCALREEVVDYVVKLLPYVVINFRSSR
jgi:hypothetical protein